MAAGGGRAIGLPRANDARLRPRWLRISAILLITTVHAAAFGSLIRLPAEAVSAPGFVEIGTIARGEIAIDAEDHPVPDVADAPPQAAASEPAAPQQSSAVSAPEPEPRAIETRPAEDDPDIPEPAKDKPAQDDAPNPSNSSAAQNAAAGASAARASARQIGADQPAADISQAAKATYAALVSAEINRHKHYPAEARRRGERGVVHLAFVVGESGKIVSHAITLSSGSSAIDAVAERMVAAARLPPPPGGKFPGTIQITFRVTP